MPDSQDDPKTQPLSGVPEPCQGAIRRRGFAALSKIQEAVLAAESEGRDLRISSQTGSGKTVAIGLALAKDLIDSKAASRRSRGPTILVLVPTRELAMQVRNELCWLFEDLPGFACQVVMGGTSIGVERRALARRPDVVVATPGRALDHLRAGALRCDEVAHVVLDEADRMLDMGFREELEAILDQLPTERRSHLVSATLPSAVRKLADAFQRSPLHIEGTRLGVANQDIEHVAHLIDRRDSYAALVNLLLLNEGARCLVFVERRVDVSSLAAKLASDEFPVQSFSGDLPQAQRTRTLDAFRGGTIKTLISTDVAARGIDVPDIELVIHVDPPNDADTYIHRSGRTGRAGRRGRSVLLVTPRGRAQVARLLQSAKIDAEWKPAPGASRVRKALRKRFRAHLHARLASEEAPNQKQIDYAKRLLDGREPAEVVAALLELAKPEPAREPMEIRDPHDAPDSQAGAGRTRFTINWGEKNGAAANRLLGHICRRGQIRGHQVGAIEIGRDESSFDIDSSVAGRFEKLVRRPDPRDPKLRILRLATPGQRSADNQGRHEGHKKFRPRRPQKGRGSRGIARPRWQEKRSK